MPTAYDEHLGFFGGPQGYAAAIKQREGSGEKLSDPVAAAAFKAARPDLFRSTAQTSTLPSNFSIKPRQLSSGVTKLMDSVNRAVTRGPVTADDIMDSPEYGAQMKVLDFEKGQSQAGLRRDMASRGMLRGTPSVQALAAEDARYEAARSAAVPQLLNAATARQQAGVQNLLSALNAALGVEQTSFNQGLGQFQALAPYQYDTIAGQREADQFSHLFPLREAEATGMYNGQLTPSARAAIAALSGIDPTTGDKTWERIFGEKQLSNESARIAKAASGGGGYSSSQRFDDLMKIWSLTGEAPAGLEGFGVKPGTGLKGTGKPTDEKLFQAALPEYMESIDSNRKSLKQVYEEIDRYMKAGSYSNNLGEIMKATLKDMYETSGSTYQPEYPDYSNPYETLLLE